MSQAMERAGRVTRTTRKPGASENRDGARGRLMSLRADVARYAKKMHDSGLVRATQGNLSARDPKSGLIYVTPSGAEYDSLGAEDIVVVTGDGEISRRELETQRGSPRAPRGLPASRGRELCHAHPFHLRDRVRRSLSPLPDDPRRVGVLSGRRGPYRALPGVRHIGVRESWLRAILAPGQRSSGATTARWWRRVRSRWRIRSRMRLRIARVSTGWPARLASHARSPRMRFSGCMPHGSPVMASVRSIRRTNRSQRYVAPMRE